MIAFALGVWFGGALLTACFEHQENKFYKGESVSAWHSVINVIFWPALTLSLILNSHQEDDLNDD